MVDVSVIIPVYNAEKYIRTALDSLINQTLTNIEIICVDDGSTDSSYEILQEYQKNDDRFILLRQKNSFAGVARNYGMKAASGEYICFLDADDFFENNMLQRLYEKAKTSDADIVLCDAFNYDDRNGEIIDVKGILRSEFLVNLPETFSYKMIPERIFQITSPVPWNKMFKRDFVQKHQLEFQNTKRSNDEYFVNISLIYADRISFVDERLLYYRINNFDSLQGMGKETRPSLDFFVALKAIKNELIRMDAYPLIERSFINKAVSTCISMLRKQKSANNYIYIYQFIKQEVFEKLEILNRSSDYFYANYAEIQDIISMEPEEYLYKKLLIMKENECHKFSYKPLGQARRIVLYGAGKVGKDYFGEIIKSNYYTLVAWADRNYQKFDNYYPEVIAPEKIKELEFDKIVIAIEDEKVRKEVKNYLMQQGIDEKKIVHKLR